MEAAWLAAEKAERKATKKGKKGAVEESGADVGADGPKQQRQKKWGMMMRERWHVRLRQHR